MGVFVRTPVDGITLRYVPGLSPNLLTKQDSVGGLLFATNPGFVTVTKTGTYTVTIDDHVIFVNGVFTVTLPTPVGFAGMWFTLKKIDAGAASTIATTAGLIDGAATYSLSAQYKYVTVISDGSNWYVTANN